MNHFLLKIKKNISDFFSFLADERCIGCGNEIGFICKDCHKKITFNRNFCSLCAYPLSEGIEDLICGNCLKNKPLFTKTIAPLIYDGLVRDILISAKFNRKYFFIERLIDQIFQDCEYLFEHIESAEAIIPVPLSRKRLIERGYNQSVIIGEYLAKKLNKPLILNNLIKIKDTQPQSQLGEKERFSNVKNAYVLKKTINFSKIILVDDIITTSATVSEVTKVLKKGGVNEIYIFSLCRATF